MFVLIFERFKKDPDIIENGKCFFLKISTKKKLEKNKRKLRQECDLSQQQPVKTKSFIVNERRPSTTRNPEEETPKKINPTTGRM